MFTGIIETIGTVENIVKEEENFHFTIQSSIANELKIDQSVSHNGVCLTVVKIVEDKYVVTAIYETMQKTNLGKLQQGEKVNLERAMMPSARLDGHFVQGHVDKTAICKSVEEQDGSWLYTFEFDPDDNSILVEKGSITVNGVSLTVFNIKENAFSVAIIPYTYEHTNFHSFKPGTTVNLEFDVIGKYITKLFMKYNTAING